ncbi:glycosyltransferase family 9 protein [Ferruginibacter albus]|uniref:glycosyltransferase family 9 protein n=1 Tax=Ferruginibacter albus TaxID=2875540 RepID=UPI001CC69FDB|nr:glycosyltransferase family 9 protein [Ferruginibacter albus]UAY52825.1 glycosyltransferase family 9 protein [Ferruginibacter albus]
MQQTKILIRLPNWLGDLVMSTAFVQAVKEIYPDAIIDIIVKKGIDVLTEQFPSYRKKYIFSKQHYKGLRGAWKFGKEIAAQEQYDLFFCLPDSLSSAVMAKAVNAKQRIGYKKELRSLFLTHSYQKKKGIHRVEEYIDLLQQFTNKAIGNITVTLNKHASDKRNAIIVNINSEASSRRLPKEKAVSIIDTIRKNIQEEIILIGSDKEKPFVDEVYAALTDKNNIANLSAQTDLQQLAALMGSCKLVLTTDSGPAHVANAVGSNTLVLFGAGNENNTAPYNKVNCQIIRLGQLSCEPCLKNKCELYGVPKCLLLLDENKIVTEVKKFLNQ